MLTSHLDDVKLRTGILTFGYSNGTHIRSGITEGR